MTKLSHLSRLDCVTVIHHHHFWGVNNSIKCPYIFTCKTIYLIHLKWTEYAIFQSLEVDEIHVWKYVMWIALWKRDNCMLILIITSEGQNFEYEMWRQKKIVKMDSSIMYKQIKWYSPERVYLATHVD